MDQLTFETINSKYIIDTSSILAQKSDRDQRRNVYRMLWKKIDQYIQDRMIVICSEIYDEVKDKEISEWLRSCGCFIVPIDDLIQKNVIRIVNEHPKMITFNGGKSGTSSGDAFLIATAMSFDLTVITEENPDNPQKIPQICKSYKINCVNLTELAEREGWEF